MWIVRMYMSSVVDRYTKEFLPYCDTAHITKVDYSYEADTYISDFDKLKRLENYRTE